MDELYFSNVGVFSDLYLEKVLFEYEGEPIIFICSNKKKKFLCNCYDFRYELKWILSETNNNIILNLLDNEVTLRDAFLLSDKKKIQIIIDENDKTNIKELNANDIDMSILPAEGVGLRVNTSGISAYMLQLSKEIKANTVFEEKYEFKEINQYYINSGFDVNEMRQKINFEYYENTLNYIQEGQASFINIFKENLQYLLTKFNQTLTQTNECLDCLETTLSEKIETKVGSAYFEEFVFDDDFSKVA